jgi:outer membrane lipase/esterase
VSAHGPLVELVARRIALKSFRGIRVLFWALLLGAAVSAQSVAAAVPSFCGVYLVGDSISDTGNLVALAAQVPIDPIPVPAGLVLNVTRFSDGQLWVEYLASQLNHGGDAAPFFAFSGGKNLAIAGSSLLADLSSLPPEFGLQRQLSSQVGTLIAANAGSLPACGLYIILSGNNDVLSLLDAVSQGTIPLAGLLPVLNQAAGQVIAAVQALYTAGSRNFLVANVSNVGLTPSLHGNEALGSIVAATFNTILLGKILPLQGGPSGRLWYLSSYAVSSAIAVDARFFRGRKTGITNWQTPCAPVFGSGIPCSKSLFWDSVHPTTAAHKIFAHAALELLQGRPLILNP